MGEVTSLDQKQVYCLVSDASLHQELTQRLATHAITLCRVPDPQVLRESCARHIPDAFVLDIGLLADQPLEPFVAALPRPQVGKPPAVICLGADASAIAWRLEAARCGAEVASPDAEDLAERLTKRLSSTRVPLRVLIVDTDRAHARLHKMMLNAAGIDADLLTTPLDLLERLRSARPDALLLTLDMPGPTGDELARVLRDHPIHHDLPLLFLSGDPRQLQRQVVQELGDGLLKPVRHAELVSAITRTVARHRGFVQRWHSARRRQDASAVIRRQTFLGQVHRLMQTPHPESWSLLVVDLDERQRLLRLLGVSSIERLMHGLGPRIAQPLTGPESTTRIGDFRYAVLVQREGSAVTALARAIATGVRSLVVESNEGPLQPTVSIGIAPFAPPARDATGLIARASKAAKAARRFGGNQVAQWTPSTTDDDAEILPLVDGALTTDGGFQLHYQPILSIRRRHSEFYEALLRLRTPDSEMIAPADFLRVADQHGKGDAVDRWALAKGLDTLAAYNDRQQPIRLMVHQQLSTVAAPEWLDWFRDQISDRGLIKCPPLLVLQAHELADHLSVARPLVGQLTRLGVHLCAANVTGASGQLAMLDELAIKLVKLPLNRIADSGGEMLEGLIAWLRRRKIAVIASGVEDHATLGLAWTLRPTYVQGHFLQMPGADLECDLEKVA